MSRHRRIQLIDLDKHRRHFHSGWIHDTHNNVVLIGPNKTGFTTLNKTFPREYHRSGVLPIHLSDTPTVAVIRDPFKRFCALLNQFILGRSMTLMNQEGRFANAASNDIAKDFGEETFDLWFPRNDTITDPVNHTLWFIDEVMPQLETWGRDLHFVSLTRFYTVMGVDLDKPNVHVVDTPELDRWVRKMTGRRVRREDRNASIYVLEPEQYELFRKPIEQHWAQDVKLYKRYIQR